MIEQSRNSFPECEKLASVSEESNKIGQFLEWLLDDKQYCIAQYYDDDMALSDVCRSINDLLAEYFNIDLNEVERERRIMLDELRQNNQARDNFDKHE